MELYKLLPEFKGPNMLPPERMAHFRDNIRPNMQYCGLFFLKRLTAWCEYIREYDAKMSNLGTTNGTSRKGAIQGGNKSDMHSIIEGISDAGCYDTYNCNVAELALTMYIFMIIILLVALLGFIGNFGCLVRLLQRRHRQPFSSYLVSLIVVDCLGLIFALIVFVCPHLAGPSHQQQLQAYQRTYAKVIPIMLPLWDYTRLVATWITVALLIQRSGVTQERLYRKQYEGNDVDNQKENVQQGGKSQRRIVLCRLIILYVALFFLCVPKFAEYTSNVDFQTHKAILIPLLRVLKLYRMIMLKLIYPSIEFVVPILMTLAYIAVIKYHEMLLTRCCLMQDIYNGEEDRYSRRSIPHDCETGCIHGGMSFLSSAAKSGQKSKERATDQSCLVSSSIDGITITATNTMLPICDEPLIAKSNAVVFSVSGVSRRTQLVMWLSTVLLLHLTVQLSTHLVSIERKLEGVPREQWPKLRQIVKLVSTIFCIVAISVKPIIYIVCFPHLFPLKRFFPSQSSEPVSQQVQHENSIE